MNELVKLVRLGEGGRRRAARIGLVGQGGKQKQRRLVWLGQRWNGKQVAGDSTNASNIFFDLT